MKSKLVKYPFNDGKRYRWDTYKMGKRFQYFWEQSEPNNFETITPYIKAEPFVYDDSNIYSIVSLSDNIPDTPVVTSTFTSSLQNYKQSALADQTVNWGWHSGTIPPEWRGESVTHKNSTIEASYRIKFQEGASGVSARRVVYRQEGNDTLLYATYPVNGYPSLSSTDTIVAYEASPVFTTGQQQSLNPNLITVIDDNEWQV